MGILYATKYKTKNLLLLEIIQLGYRDISREEYCMRFRPYVVLFFFDWDIYSSLFLRSYMYCNLSLNA